MHGICLQIDAAASEYMGIGYAILYNVDSQYNML